MASPGVSVMLYPLLSAGSVAKSSPMKPSPSTAVVGGVARFERLGA